MIVAIAAGWWWLRRQHPAQEPVQVASQFVHLLRTQQLAEAQALTMPGLIPPSPGDFAVFAQRQLCGPFTQSEVFPFQSNGNRLRRWLLGREVEMPEINVQYLGECAFRVTLRPDRAGQWKVYQFGSHAW